MLACESDIRNGVIESVYFSDGVFKINRHGSEQAREIVVTNYAIYLVCGNRYYIAIASI